MKLVNHTPKNANLLIKSYNNIATNFLLMIFIPNPKKKLPICDSQSFYCGMNVIIAKGDLLIQK